MVWKGFREANGSWNTICTWSRYARPGTLRPSGPSAVIEPELGFSRRAIIRATVDLPEPDSPTRATVRPGTRVKETRSAARRVERRSPDRRV